MSEIIDGVNEDVIISALKKKALGYEFDEVVEDYSIGEDGKPILSKRKVTRKNIPPDISSAKLLLSMINGGEFNFESYSDEELLSEKMRLLEIIEKGESDECK